jgi:hypothetical protein
VWQLTNLYSLGGQTYDWAGWESWLYETLQDQVANRGSFDIDHIILGEFGIWRGEGSDMGLTAWSFTDMNRIDYYTHYFNVIKRLELKNVCFHYSIEENAQYGNANYCRYGMITPVPDGIHYTSSAGMLYPGGEVIKSNLGSTTTTTTSPSCTSLTLSPASGAPSYTVTASVASSACKVCNYLGCSGSGCTGTQIRTGSGTFTALGAAGTYGYYACPGGGHSTITVT